MKQLHWFRKFLIQIPRKNKGAPKRRCRRLDLAFLGVLFALSGNAYSANIDCNIGAEKGTIDRLRLLDGGTTPYPNSFIGGCKTSEFNNHVGIIYYSGTNLLVGNDSTSRFNASPTLEPHVNIGNLTTDFAYMKDMGTSAQNFETCSTTTYIIDNAVQANNGNWYCARFEGTIHTGYLYAQYVNDTFLLAPPSVKPVVDCNKGAQLGSLGAYDNSIIANCSFLKESSVWLGLIESGNLIYAGRQGTSLPPAPSPTNLGAKLTSKLIDIGASKPYNFDCSTADFSAITNSSEPAIVDHWYCAEFVGDNATGYIIGRYKGSSLGFYPPGNEIAALDIDDSGSVDALTDGLLVLRYLFGFRDNSLISDATATGAKRTSANSIQTYLAPLTTPAP